MERKGIRAQGQRDSGRQAGGQADRQTNKNRQTETEMPNCLDYIGRNLWGFGSNFRNFRLKYILSKIILRLS